MKYRKLILSTAVVGGIIASVASGAWALDLSVNTDTHGTGPLELATLLTLITLAPALLIMLTSFTRIVIVLSLLRQALGLQQTPPNIVITGLALFLTMLVLATPWSLTGLSSSRLKTRSPMPKGRCETSCYGRHGSRISRWRAGCSRRAISRS